jgi:hypothetical protein
MNLDSHELHILNILHFCHIFENLVVDRLQALEVGNIFSWHQHLFNLKQLFFIDYLKFKNYENLTGSNSHKNKN